MTIESYYEDGQVTLLHATCEDALPTIPDNSIDAVICDPPYNLPGGFMGAAWDNIGAGKAFQAWCETWARECLRALKPGGHLLAFGSPRTYHRLAAGIEDAGFEIRDSIHWIYGGGFPKGQDIGKHIDKQRADRPDVLRVTAWLSAARIAAGWTIRQIDDLFGFNGMASHWCATENKAAAAPTLEQWVKLRDAMGFDDTEILPAVEYLNGRKGQIGEAYQQREVLADNPRATRKPEHLYGEFSGDGRVTLPASDAARNWDGWNTQLKPAHEPIIVARKSTGYNTTVANVLEHGTGALNINACRIEVRDNAYARNAAGDRGHEDNRSREMDFRQTAGHANDLGRWPTNVAFAHDERCAQACAPGCPVSELDAQSGVLTSGANPTRRAAPKFGHAYGEFEGDRDCAAARGSDSGSASRFFPAFRYQAKAPQGERPKLADGTQWPTVKPLDLMRWLVRLVTPPGGMILDPFCGTGPTGEAAIVEGFRCILIEQDPVAAELVKVRLSKPLQPSLFGEA